MGKENFILLTDSFCASSLEDTPTPIMLANTPTFVLFPLLSDVVNDRLNSIFVI